MLEQSTVSSPFSSSTMAHSTFSPALTHRVPPPGSSQQYTGSPFASVSFHPTRHGSMSNTTSSTVSIVSAGSRARASSNPTWIPCRRHRSHHRRAHHRRRHHRAAFERSKWSIARVRARCGPRSSVFVCRRVDSFTAHSRDSYKDTPNRRRLESGSVRPEVQPSAPGPAVGENPH